jgi:hypothetical protein
VYPALLNVRVSLAERHFVQQLDVVGEPLLM